ncbi:MAG TPA: amino acid permease [Candidatus Binataceae bacterium]|nr:amino acid permease [Candidatus Binataceae bacterium]
MRKDSPHRKDHDEVLRQDAETLRELGYAQVLVREMGGFSSFALSFTIISVLTGAVLLYGYGLKYGGPIVNTVGWPIVSVFVLCVAASMAEIASTYPTAGGLYYWSLRLGGRGWGWSCAWLNLIGQITITAGTNIGAAAYLVGLVTDVFRLPAGAAVPILGPISGWNFWLAVMALLMVVQVIINLRGVRLIAILNEFSVAWHVAGVCLIAGLLTIAGKYHNGWSFLLSTTHYATLSQGMDHFRVGPLSVPSLMMRIPGIKQLYGSGLYAFSFVLGLLQAQWTYTGYDASAHMAEETYLARINSAWGIFLSVAGSAITGYIVLLALTRAIPPGHLAETANDPYPVLYIVRNSLSPFFANLIGVIIAGAMWLCGLASVTSMARMCFAFARDRGVPGGAWLGRVDSSGTPAAAIVATSALAVAVTFYSAAYAVVTSISTTALYLAYVIPIYLNWRNRRRNRGEYTGGASTPWRLGRFGPAIDLIAMAWVGFITILFSIPPNELAGLTMILFGIILTAYWRLSQRQHFHPPVVLNNR